MPLPARVALSFAFRIGCYAAMLWMALWAESRPAPSLPDAVLQHVPYVPAVDRYNYVLWLVAYVPVALALLFRDAERFCGYMVSSGLVALLRGVCIAATGLGPVRGADVNAGMTLEQRANAFLELVWPLDFFTGQTPHVYLTKDLFFSGHTATTFLLLLYVFCDRALRWPMLAGHFAVVAAVFLSHLHYTIDVIGGYLAAFAVYVLREADLRALLSPPRPETASGSPRPG